jgi:5'-methylthioadenosine phosphorylase
MSDLAILMPCPSGASAPYATPFGDAHVQERVLGGRALALIEPGDDPRAGPWAARALGATRLAIVCTGAALNRLLRPLDWLLPDDYVDQTRGGPTTYFTERGLGYVQQSPAFCPELRAALAAMPERPDARVFDRGTLVAAPAPRPETPAEARWWRGLGGDVAAWGAQPAAALARELELCVAVACYVVRAAGAADDAWLEAPEVERLLAALVAALPAARGCACGEALAAARARGALEMDWWKVLSV